MPKISAAKFETRSGARNGHTHTSWRGIFRFDPREGRG